MKALQLWLAALLIAGCASFFTNPALEEARALVAQDRVEEAIALVQSLLKDDPTNAEYKNFVARQRELAVGRLLAQGDSARRAGALEEAQNAYARVQRLEPLNSRASAGLAAVQMDLRHRKILAEAEAAFAKNDFAGAEARLAAIFTQNPQHRGALELQRKLVERRAFAESAPPVLGPAFQKPISVEFRDANLRSVFDALARSHDVNFVFDKDVRTDIRVTIFVRNTSIDDAISLILATNQLARKVLGSNSVLIYPNTPAKQREYQDLVMRSFYLGNTDAKQALAMIKTMVKTRDVYVDEKVNLLVMRDTPDAIRIAEKLLATLDVAEPEVVLELDVLEVARSRLLELGVQFPTQVNFGVPGVAGQAPPAVIEPSRGNLIATIANPAIVVNLKQQDSSTKVLANPRIRVRNRDKARVHIGEKVPVVTTTSTANVGVSASVSYLEVGLKLDVEPDIHLDDEVAMKVGLEVSNILETIDISGTRAYRLGTRNAATVLRLKDSETQVLAGLISDEDRRSANKVPGLSELPLVGRLFNSSNDTLTKSEIVLLITPRVVRNIARREVQNMEFASGTDLSVGAPPLRLSTATAGVALASRSGSAPAPPAGPIPAPVPADTGVAVAPPFAPPPPPGGAGEPPKPMAVTMSAPAQAALGSVFGVSITVPPPARSAEFELVFDPSVLQLIGAGGDPTQPVTVAPSAPGRISLRMQAQPGGAIGAAAMQFRVIASSTGTTQLNVAGTSVLDEQGRSLPIAPVPPHTLAVGQ